MAAKTTTIDAEAVRQVIRAEVHTQLDQLRRDVAEVVAEAVSARGGGGFAAQQAPPPADWAERRADLFARLAAGSKDAKPGDMRKIIEQFKRDYAQAAIRKMEGS